MKHWKDVTVDMMSEEENDSAREVYIRHQPSYRSKLLTDFLDELDRRSDKRNKKNNRPKTRRIVGEPLNTPPPPGIPKWIQNDDQVADDAHNNDGLGELSEDYNDEDSEDDDEHLLSCYTN